VTDRGPNDPPPFTLRDGIHYTSTRVRQWTGATERQLRYWARKGIAKPSIQDTTTSGRPRLYSAEDLRWIRELVNLLADGWSLQSIGFQLELAFTLDEIRRNRWRATNRIPWRFRERRSA
jgi:DNA-binding transcriptional MerR regulator